MNPVSSPVPSPSCGRRRNSACISTSPIKIVMPKLNQLAAAPNAMRRLMLTLENQRFVVIRKSSTAKMNAHQRRLAGSKSLVSLARFALEGIIQKLSADMLFSIANAPERHKLKSAIPTRITRMKWIGSPSAVFRSESPVFRRLLPNLSALYSSMFVRSSFDDHSMTVRMANFAAIHVRSERGG